MPRRERRYASLKTAAEYVHGTETTLRNMIARGQLRRYNFGRHVRIDLNELDALLEQPRQ